MTARTLVLTPWYFPHKVIGWQDAITLVYLDKVDVVANYDDVVRSPSTTMMLPAVIRLKRRMAAVKRGVKFSRFNVYLRDDFTCAYCRTRLPMSKLTFDHVLPRSRGGRTAWTNILTACYPCNAKKANRTPEEARMRAHKPPFRPASLPLAAPLFDPSTAPVEWRDFCVGMTHAALA